RKYRTTELPAPFTGGNSSYPYGRQKQNNRNIQNRRCAYFGCFAHLGSLLGDISTAAHTGTCAGKNVAPERTFFRKSNDCEGKRALATPEFLRCEPGSVDQRAQLGPGEVGVNPAAEAAIGAGNDILATDDRGIAKDSIGDQLRVLDQVGRVTDDAGHQHLAGRQLDRLPDPPFVLVSHVASLEGIG